MSTKENPLTKITFISMVMRYFNPDLLTESYQEYWNEEPTKVKVSPFKTIGRLATVSSAFREAIVEFGGVSTLLSTASKTKKIDWLRYACMKNVPVIIGILLNEPDLSVNTEFTGNRTPLLIACTFGFTELARYLLTYEDIDIQKFNPFIRACEKGQLGIVKLLCQCGKHFNINASNGQHTALTIAIANSRHNVLDYLLQKRTPPIIDHETQQEVPTYPPILNELDINVNDLGQSVADRSTLKTASSSDTPLIHAIKLKDIGMTMRIFNFAKEHDVTVDLTTKQHNGVASAMELLASLPYDTRDKNGKNIGFAPAVEEALKQENKDITKSLIIAMRNLDLALVKRLVKHPDVFIHGLEMTAQQLSQQTQQNWSLNEVSSNALVTVCSALTTSVSIEMLSVLLERFIEIQKEYQSGSKKFEDNQAIYPRLNINGRFPNSGKTILHVLCELGGSSNYYNGGSNNDKQHAIEKLKLFIKYFGINNLEWDAQDDDGKTPLFTATEVGAFSLMKFLVETVPIEKLGLELKGTCKGRYGANEGVLRTARQVCVDKGSAWDRGTQILDQATKKK